jgi:hypothetical protein
MTHINVLWRSILVLWLSTASALTTASDTPYHRTVDGIAVYIGIVPAEMVRGHPPEHPEATMHGGVPVGESHLTVAVYDAKSGRRIRNATVAARVTDDRGIVNVRKTLEPMLIADSPTFGGYFSMQSAGSYRIEIEIQVPGRTKAVMATFTWVRS